MNRGIHLAFSLGPFKDGVYQYVFLEKLKIIFNYGFSILGGSLSNIYWSLEAVPRFFRENWDNRIISLFFFSISLGHIYFSYRLLKYITQLEHVKWYLWGIWIVNSCIWFFMGSIIPLLMSL